MSLVLWKPADNQENGFRKHYRDGAKVEHDFPYWLDVFGIEDEPTPTNFIDALKQAWEEDWSVAFSQFKPKPLNELRDAVCPKGKPLISPEGFWRRTNTVLEDSMMSFAVLDFDCDHPSVSFSSSVQERMDAAKSLLPLLSSLEAVAFYSSSANFENAAKPNRMNLHIVIWFDRPYPRETVRAFLLQHKDVVDAALAVKTQPHIIANPIFENTVRVDLTGERVVHFPGERLCLDELNLEIHEPVIRSKGKKDKPLSHDSQTKAAQIEAMAEAGELDGRRNNFLYKEIWRENFFNDGETDAFLDAINKPIITTGKDGKTHDIFEMDSRAKFHIHKKLTGEEFSGKRNHQKIIEHLDLADYDISELPTKKAVITLKSGCGSGKTKGFIRRMIEASGYDRGLLLAPFKATLEPAAKDLGFAYYLEKGEEDKRDWMRSQNWLATTDKSLGALFDEDGTYKKFPIVILDESERLALNSADVMSRQHELFEVCRAADLVLLLDADVSDDLTVWFAKEIADKSTEQKELLSLINTKDWMGEGHHCYQLENEADTFGIIEKLLEQDKRVYFHCGFSDTTEERRISAIVRMFQESFPNKKILGFDAASAPQQLRKNANEYIDWLIEEEGLDLLIHSPWSKVGWDYNGKHHFDATVGSYPHTFMTAPDIAQQMRRPRQTKLHYVWTGRRPKNAEQRLIDLQTTWDEDADLKKLKRDTPAELAERARRKVAREQSNIGLHLKMILKERDCRYHSGFSTDIDEGQVAHLLTKYGEEAEAEKIAKAWRDSWERDNILADFYYFKNYGEGRKKASEKEIRSELTEEDFAVLYRRKLSTAEKDIAAISKIWFLDEDARSLLDADDSRWFAEITGILLDAVDELVRKNIGNPDSFIKWMEKENETDLFIQFNKADFQKIIDLFNDKRSRYGDFIPWVNEGAMKKNFCLFFEEMAAFYDLGFEILETPKTPKPEAKKNIILHFMNQGLLKKSRAKTMRDIGKKIAFIENHIDQKREQNEPLDAQEELWMRYRSDYFLHFYKHKLRNETVNRALRKLL